MGSNSPTKPVIHEEVGAIEKLPYPPGRKMMLLQPPRPVAVLRLALLIVPLVSAFLYAWVQLFGGKH